jgi:integrase
VTSGVRQEEALALDIDDVKERDGGYYIHVYKANIKIEKNKYAIVDRLKHNEKPREIPIPKETYDMLHEYYNMTMSDKKFVQKKIDNGTERLIFVNVDGRVINKHTLYENFPKYIERKIKTNDKVRLHMLRHTYASLMCDDIPIEIVSEVLGHRDISITKQFYATTTDKQKQQIFNASTNLLNKINSYNN